MLEEFNIRSVLKVQSENPTLSEDDLVKLVQKDAYDFRDKMLELGLVMYYGCTDVYEGQHGDNRNGRGGNSDPELFTYAFICHKDMTQLMDEFGLRPSSWCVFMRKRLETHVSAEMFLVSPDDPVRMYKIAMNENLGDLKPVKSPFEFNDPDEMRECFQDYDGKMHEALMAHNENDWGMKEWMIEHFRPTKKVRVEIGESDNV